MTVLSQRASDSSSNVNALKADYLACFVLSSRQVQCCGNSVHLVGPLPGTRSALRSDTSWRCMAVSHLRSGAPGTVLHTFTFIDLPVYQQSTRILCTRIVCVWHPLLRGATFSVVLSSVMVYLTLANLRAIAATACASLSKPTLPSRRHSSSTHPTTCDRRVFVDEAATACSSLSKPTLPHSSSTCLCHDRHSLSTKISCTVSRVGSEGPRSVWGVWLARALAPP